MMIQSLIFGNGLRVSAGHFYTLVTTSVELFASTIRLFSMDDHRRKRSAARAEFSIDPFAGTEVVLAHFFTANS